MSEDEAVEVTRRVRRPRGPDAPRWWRHCPSCLFEWLSDTAFGVGDVTKCPKCGADVPGELRGTARGRRP